MPPPVDSTATPDPSLTFRERIDRYWRDFSDVVCMGMLAPQTLKELVGRADLILVGRATGAQRWDDAPYSVPDDHSLVTIRVSDVLKGVPNLQAPDVIQLYHAGAPPSDTISDLNHLLFLSAVTDDQRVYRLSAGFISVYAEVDGRAVIPQYVETRDTYGHDLFTTGLDGSSFEALVDRATFLSETEPTRKSQMAKGGYFAC